MGAPHRGVVVFAASTQKRLEYAFEGSVFIGGAVVQWLRDNLRCIGASAEVEAPAAGVSDSDGIVFVPAFVGLGAPHWDPHAGGLLIGLRRDTTTGHIARSGDTRFAPKMNSAEAARKRERWKRAVERTRGWNQ